MKYHYFIVEDNPKAVESLQYMLQSKELFSFIGTSDNSKDAVSKILETKPDLLFLDVELSDGDGFEVLDELRKKNYTIPFTIMITGYDNYAKKALNNDASFFLTKPFDPDELEEALFKFKSKVLNESKQLNLKTVEGHFILNFQDILFIMSEGNYTTIFKTNGQIILITKTLKELTEKLPDHFVRIHKSYIVNSTYIELLNTNIKALIISSNTNINSMRKEVYEREKINPNNPNAQYKNISWALKNEEKIVLPIGKLYIDLLKNKLL